MIFLQNSNGFSMEIPQEKQANHQRNKGCQRGSQPHDIQRFSCITAQKSRSRNTHTKGCQHAVGKSNHRFPITAEIGIHTENKGNQYAVNGIGPQVICRCTDHLCFFGKYPRDAFRVPLTVYAKQHTKDQCISNAKPQCFSCPVRLSCSQILGCHSSNSRSKRRRRQHCENDNFFHNTYCCRRNQSQCIHNGCDYQERNIHVEDNGEGKPGSRFIIRLPLGKGHLKKEEIEETTTADTIINIPTAEPATIASPLPYDDDEEANGKVRARSRRHVLVVEDDEEIRHYICRELSNDFYMTECSNGKEALASILSHTPDLIISDVMMPEMDGLTLCRKIRQNVNINYLPIILLTARTSEEDNLEGLDTGADAYLMKPFSIELLRKTVLNLICRREQLRNAFSGRQNQEEQISIPEVKSPDDRLMERVMRVINENLGNPALTVEMISTEVGISRVHLHRKLKELTNQTTQQLIRNLRLKQAATLLADKRHSITEVATLTGFTHPTYFATAFREMYGISPSEYMERHIGQDKTKDGIF